MPEYLLQYNYKFDQRVDPFSPARNIYTAQTRIYIEAECLNEVIDEARRIRHRIQDSLTTVSPATILEKVGIHKEDGKPLYKVVITGVSSLPELNPAYFPDLHVIH